MERVMTIAMAALLALADIAGAKELSLEGAAAGLAGGVPVPAAGSPAPVPDDAGAATRDWLFLVFINGVNDLGILGYANKDINEMEAVGSTERVAVVAEFGILDIDNAADRNLRLPRGSRTIYITRDSDASVINSPVIYSADEADMGSEASLVRFVKRALRRYPARKLALVLWNHGSGTLGISHDDVSRNEMEVNKLGGALGEIERELGHKIDLFATDACLMQMAAVAYEFSAHAGVIVGSEEMVPGNGYPYTPILSALAADPGMGAEALGSLMVDAYGASYANDATLSALRGEAVRALPGPLGDWVGAVMSDPAALRAAADFTLLNSVSRFSYKDSKDLVDYIDKVSASPGVQPYVPEAARRLKDFLVRGVVIRNAAKPAYNRPYTRAAGLAIYMPGLRYDSAAYEKLSFPGESLWGEFILRVVRERLK